MATRETYDRNGNVVATETIPDPPDPATTPLTPGDTERLLLANVPGMTKAKIDQAKRDRGKPII